MYCTAMVSDDLVEGLLLQIDICWPPPKTTSMVLVMASVTENSPSHNFTNLGNQIPVYLLSKVCFSIPKHCCCTIFMLTLNIYSFLCFAGMWVGAIIPVYSKDMNMYHNVEYQF